MAEDERKDRLLSSNDDRSVIDRDGNGLVIQATIAVPMYFYSTRLVAEYADRLWSIQT